MAYDGIQNSNRVDGTTERKLAAKVVDNILNGRTYFSRLQYQAKPFEGKTMDITLKIADSGLGQFYSGLETLTVASSDTTVTTSYAHTAFTQPEVDIMLESFANAGQTGTISLPAFKHEEAAAEAVSRMGEVVYTSTGSGKQPLGLAAIVDDGSNVGTIGGQSRSTYPALKATVTGSGGTISLAKISTLEDNISAAGYDSEEPSIFLTTKSVWSLIETLLMPQIRATYSDIGYTMPNYGSEAIANNLPDIRAYGGLRALGYRGKWILKDDAASATAGTFYALNERYLNAYGRTMVPEDYTGKIEKVNLGTPTAFEGTGAQISPSKWNGWFFQPKDMLPQQSGQVARFHWIGQLIASSFRRQGKLTGVTGI